MTNFKIAICFIILITCISCTNKDKTVISLNDYTKYNFAGDRIDVKLIKSFKNDSHCSDTIKNANVYLCLDIHFNDTILLIETCQKMPDFARNDFSAERDLTIERQDIVNDKIDKIMVVNDAAVKNYKTKYILGSLTYLIYW